MPRGISKKEKKNSRGRSRITLHRSASQLQEPSSPIYNPPAQESILEAEYTSIPIDLDTKNITTQVVDDIKPTKSDDTMTTQVEVGTKNGNAGYDEYNSKANFYKKGEQDAVTKIRLFLVGRYAGALIGKGGENFKRLREVHNVKIIGLSTQANNRVLSLDGERKDCVNIVKEILQICPEGPYPAQTGTKCPFEMNLLVNTQEVGAIIGIGGSKIKEICEHTGGKLKVYSECLPNSNERVVSLGGDDESQIIDTLDIVLNLLESFPGKYKTIFYDPANINSPPGIVGGSLGPWFSGPVNDHSNMAAFLMHSRDNSQRNPDPGHPDFGQVQTVTNLIIPDAMCGAIIGKGGMNLRQVRESSGAKLDFTRSEEAGSEEFRVMTLSGTQYQIQIAQQLLAQFVGNSRNLNQVKQN